MSERVYIEIKFDISDDILIYAAEELRALLGSVSETGFAESNPRNEGKLLRIILRVDKAMQESCFSVSCNAIDNGNTVDIELAGADSSCVLHAVYTLLEKLGFIFEATGAVYPNKLDIERLSGWQTSICPAVKHRGIRQHINFPMDISSYPLEEAKEYIRNLARLRMNYITFHSYPEQWYECELADKKLIAGKFFYNQTHIIPEYPVVKDAIRNCKYFCIPEIEPLFEQPEKRSKAAIAWLQEVMKEAKRVGMKIQMSIELRDEAFEDSIKICKRLIEIYPMIDTLELITQECGGWWGGSNPPVEELKAQLEDLYGSNISEDEKLISRLKGELGQLPLTLKEMSNHLRVVEELKRQWKGKNCPALCIGVYATQHDVLKVMLEIMRKYAPADVGFSFLPAHGARQAADSVKAMDFTEEDLKRTMLYSWMEFDGSMYVQQNSVYGIQELIKYQLETFKNSQINGICFNHWRTAENRTAIRYAALACIQGYLPQEDFYVNYAESLGIKDSEKYKQAMIQLDNAETMVRNYLGNIGFCYEPCLWNSGLGIFGKYGFEILNEVRNEYLKTYELLKECLVKTKCADAEGYLEFLINRIGCTLLHLDTAIVMTELQILCKDIEPNQLLKDEKNKITHVCDFALSKANEYMENHARIIADRGCEGTLISYYHTIPVVIKKIKAYYTDGNANYVKCDSGADAPPPPAI